MAQPMSNQQQTDPTKTSFKLPVLAVVFTLMLLGAAGMTVGQRGGWNRGLDTGRNGVPDWEIDPQFQDDVFTFVRIRYDSYGG